jgi:prepilin signal peptidase PulO-like enzyme (type II secretory pathway)
MDESCSGLLILNSYYGLLIGIFYNWIVKPENCFENIDDFSGIPTRYKKFLELEPTEIASLILAPKRETRKMQRYLCKIAKRKPYPLAPLRKSNTKREIYYG